MIIVSYDMTILLYVYIIYNINNRWLFIYFIYCTIYIHISVSSNLKRIFLLLSNIEYHVFNFFKKKFNCFLTHWRSIRIFFIYVWYTFECHHKLFVVTIIDFVFAHPFRCSIIFIKFVKHFPFSSVSYVARQWSKKKKKRERSVSFFQNSKKIGVFDIPCQSERKFDDCEECL